MDRTLKIRITPYLALLTGIMLLIAHISGKDGKGIIIAAIFLIVVAIGAIIYTTKRLAKK